MTKEELHWLAGWLEGEGSFLCSSTQTRCVIVGGSTDIDVVEKLAKLIGGNVGKQNRRHNDKKHWKDFYLTRVCGEKARDLMLQLYPLMGRRRKEQIKKAIDNYEPRDVKFTDEVIAEIKSLSGKMSQSAIAEKFNTARTTVNKIVNGKYLVV